MKGLKDSYYLEMQINSTVTLSKNGVVPLLSHSCSIPIPNKICFTEVSIAQYRIVIFFFAQKSGWGPLFDFFSDFLVTRNALNDVNLK